MSEELVIRKNIPTGIPGLDQAELLRFLHIFDNASTKEPSKKDLATIRTHLEQHPELGRELLGLSGITEQRIINRLFKEPALRLSVGAECEAMRRGLGFGQVPLLEQILIEHVVLCWLRFQDVNDRYENKMGGPYTIDEGDYWERRLSAAQRRYLRACEALARVRKLSINVQVNIANQQIVAR